MQLTRHRLASILGYLILWVFTVALFGIGLVESGGYHATVVIIKALWIVGFVFEAVREWKSAYSAESREQRFDFPKDSASFISVIVGAVVAYWISVTLGRGAVVGSALVGLYAATMIKTLAVPLYCGSFVGMASAQVLGYPELLLAGAIGGGIFVLGKHVFNGFGGKLGTVAFAACISAALITGSPFVGGPVPGWDVGGLLVFYCVVGAMFTFILNIWFGHGPVMASAVVGLAGGLLLPAAYGAPAGNLYAIGVFSASFAGMSGTNRFERSFWMIPAGVMCALIIMYTAPYLGGAGGKLGTTAFGAVIGVRGLMVIGMNIQYRLGWRDRDEAVPGS